MARVWDVFAVIAVGGGIGAVARYGVSVAFPQPPRDFPWPILLINTVGCALIGVLMVVITEVVTPHRYVRPFLGVGVLGGFTTFSTYAVDAVRLANAGRPAVALAYLVATPLAALAAVVVGVLGAQLSLRGRGGAR
jgi:CrcB protein